MTLQILQTIPLFRSRLRLRSKMIFRLRQEIVFQRPNTLRSKVHSRGVTNAKREFGREHSSAFELQWTDRPGCPGRVQQRCPFQCFRSFEEECHPGLMKSSSLQTAESHAQISICPQARRSDHFVASRNTRTASRSACGLPLFCEHRLENRRCPAAARQRAASACGSHPPVAAAAAHP